MHDHLDAWLQQAIVAARAGQKEEARQLLVTILQANPGVEAAWLWMSAVVDTPAERVHCLKQVLAINPHSEVARKGLQVLGVHEGLPAIPEVSPVGTPAPDGVPLVSAEVVARAQREIEELLSPLLAAEQPDSLPIVWSEPDRSAGRSTVGIDLRPSPMMLVVGASVVLVVVVVLLVSGISRSVRAEAVAANTTPRPTPTHTPVAISTPTPLPTRTPAPPSAFSVPEPTLPISDAPRGDLRFGLTPTAPYVLTPHPSDQELEQAITAYHEGRYKDALALLEQVQAGDDNAIDAYYYEALTHSALGDMDRAVQVANQGMAQDDGFAPLHALLARIYTQQGAIERARLAGERAQSLDPRLVDGYLVMADLSLAEGDYEAALAQVQAGRTIRKYDTNLLVMASRIYLAAGDAENATAYANLAYYVDPGSEQVVLSLARGRLALGLDTLAVIGLEDYVNGVNPSSASAWALLGQAYGRQQRTADAQMAFARALQLSDGASPLALAGRGRMYLERGEHALAYQDLSAALAHSGVADGALRLDHARAAFAVGAYDEVLADLDLLLAADPEQPALDVLYIRALVGDHRYEEAAERATALLSVALTLPLDEEQQGYLYEARARAYYALDRFAEARADMAQALALGETGTRHYYNALIHAALAENTPAIRELEWVLFWNNTFDYPFAADAAAQLAALRQEERTAQ